jgi:hypothetical protein
MVAVVSVIFVAWTLLITNASIGPGVGVGETLGVAVGVEVTRGVAVGVEVTRGVAVGVTSEVGVAVGVIIGTCVEPGVGVGVGVVDIGVGVGVAVGLRLRVNAVVVVVNAERSFDTSCMPLLSKFTFVDKELAVLAFNLMDAILKVPEGRLEV